jgi:hypothetical protein
MFAKKEQMQKTNHPNRRRRRWRRRRNSQPSISVNETLTGEKTKMSTQHDATMKSIDNANL